MAYYTERHTMREPVKKTYDISVDVYTLIFQCCEIITTTWRGSIRISALTDTVVAD